MTTVAFRDGIMAADSRGTDAGMGICKLQKLFVKTVGRKQHLIGVCGEYDAAMLFVDWYGTNDNELLRRLTSLSTDDDFGVMVWTGRKLLGANRIMRLTAFEEPYAAIGSGAGHAITALDCGKNAVTAVRMAAKRDPATGGRVVSMKL